MNTKQAFVIIQDYLSNSVIKLTIAWLGVCFGFSTLRSSEVSIDVANTKILLSGKINATQQQLQQTLLELEKTQLELQSYKSKRAASENKKAIDNLKPQIEGSIEELKGINEELAK